jgi:hypothetical protein
MNIKSLALSAVLIATLSASTGASAAIVTGTIYNDVNGNGFQDVGEPGLPSWLAEVRDSSNNLIANAITDILGQYAIPIAGVGDFTVDEVLQPGWTQTGPASGFYSLAIVDSNSSFTGLDFGNRLAPTVPEPSTWAMMILGFCGVGFMAYRKRKNGLALAA